MSLRYQIAGLLVVLSLVLVATTYAVQALVVMPAFAELERQTALRNVARCLDALDNDIESLSNTANDWASWDDSYRYIDDHNDTFRKSNLIDEAFSNTHINLICFLDGRRRIVWGEARDMETLAPIDVPDLFAALSDEECPLTVHTEVDDARQGLLMTSRGPLLAAARPIITTKRQGPIRGSIVMGKFLNESEITHLADRTHLALAIWPAAASDLPAGAARFLDEGSGEATPFLETVDEQTLHAFAAIRDIYGRPAIVVRIESPRDVMAQGRVSANAATACGIAGGLLTLAAMWAVVSWRIVGPLQKMAAHAVRVGNEDDLKSKLAIVRCDEIGALAGEFDAMVAKLAESRKTVLDSAHRAGMAEIATEVLHNVGNAVNSANCSVEFLGERLTSSKLAALDRAAALLREQAPRAGEFFSRDPRGPKLVEFLIDLNDALRQEREDLTVELNRLRGAVRHIRDAIATQQTYAGRSDFRQEVDLARLIDESLEINREAIRLAEVQVAIHLPPLPELQLNKSKITQVMVNLVRNAVQAMQEQRGGARMLTLSAKVVDDDAIEIEVRDTGVGFNDDVREKLFTHGFTTKAEGTGFGLHHCANVVREAGGCVAAYSAGPGRGAIFRLRLPNVLPAPLAAIAS